MIRILLIAQPSGLEKVGAEVQAIVNTDDLDVTLLQSGVTIAVLLDFNWAGYEVIWFAAHGTEAGIQIGDEILDIETLTSLLLQSDAGLVFINTCASERIAEQIYAACNIPVICTIAPTEDATAYVVGRRFARALARSNGNYRRAYELSAGGNKNYRYIPNVYAGVARGRKMAQGPDLEGQVEALVRALTGDKFSSNAGLIAELATLRRELSEYIRQNEDWKNQIELMMAKSQQFRPLQLTPLSAILITAGLILFIALLFLSVYWVVNGMG